MRQLKISKSITNRESQSIEKYLLEIGKEELITAEEEVQLARKIREGDQRATLLGLGLKRANQVVELEDTPSIQGMIRKVNHLIEIVK